MVNTDQVVEYHKKKRVIPTVVRSQVKKNKSIIYGGHALNTHLPSHLDRHTEDFDIFADKPKKRAQELEKRLDKRFKGDSFRVKRARHPGTYRVMSRVTEKEVADFSKPKKKVPFVRRGGVRVASLPWIETNLRSTLRDPESKFRHNKDRDALRRIQAMKREKILRKRRIRLF